MSGDGDGDDDGNGNGVKHSLTLRYGSLEVWSYITV
jgi:hypothetical protein